MLFVGLSIVLNYILTKRYGIIGTAYGGLFAVIAFNLTRFLYIKKLYKLQPFTWWNLITVTVAIILYGVIGNVPILGNIWINAVLKSGAFFLLFSLFIIKFNISTDLTELFYIARSKLRITKKG